MPLEKASGSQPEVILCRPIVLVTLTRAMSDDRCVVLSWSLWHGEVGQFNVKVILYSSNHWSYVDHLPVTPERCWRGPASVDLT